MCAVSKVLLKQPLQKDGCIFIKYDVSVRAENYGNYKNTVEAQRELSADSRQIYGFLFY